MSVGPQGWQMKGIPGLDESVTPRPEVDPPKAPTVRSPGSKPAKGTRPPEFIPQKSGPDMASVGPEVSNDPGFMSASGPPVASDDPGFMSAGTPGAGGGPGGGGPKNGPNVEVTAEFAPGLQGLLDRHNAYLADQSEGGSINSALARLKQKELQTGMARQFGAGGASPAGMASFKDSGERNAAAMDYTLDTEGEKTYGRELRGNLALAKAPTEMALREKNFGVDALNARNKANHEMWMLDRDRKRQELNDWMAMIDMQRSSPAYEAV